MLVHTRHERNSLYSSQFKILESVHATLLLANHMHAAACRSSSVMMQRLPMMMVFKIRPQKHILHPVSPLASIYTVISEYILHSLSTHTYMYVYSFLGFEDKYVN